MTVKREGGESIEQNTSATIMSSRRYDTAMAFHGDFATLDVATMLSRRTDNCIHTFLPESIAPPAKDNVAFGEHISRLRDIMQKFPVTAKEVMEDGAKNMVIVHATSQAHFHEEFKDDGISSEEWVYRGEYIFMLTMNESGDKIKKVVEFVDSKGTERLLGLMKRARSNMQKARAERV